jgi:hypothetical protein
VDVGTDGLKSSGGRFTATGAVPEFLEELREAGVKVPTLDIFEVAPRHE